MYTPTLSLTHKIVHYLIKLEHAAKEIRNSPISIKTREKVLDRMSAENIYNIGKFTGVEISFKEAEKISRGKSLISPGTKVGFLSNYRSSLDFIYSSGNDEYISFSPSLLLHLNKLLLNGIVDSWDAGRFRNINEEPRDTYDAWLNKADTDNAGAELQKHFFEVLNWYSENKFMIHPVVKIACVIYELFNTYPFVAGNQVTIAATTELLFEKSKLSLGGIFPVARNFVLYDEEYIGALTSCQKNNNNLTTWVETFVRGVALDIVSIKNEVIRIEEEKVQMKKKRLLDLNSRQLKIVKHLRHNKNRISRSDYVKMMGVSTMTAYRDLNELVDRKIIEQRGGGRSTHYRLIQDDSKKNTDPNDWKKVNKPKVVKVISDSAHSDVDSNFNKKTGESQSNFSRNFDSDR